MALQRPGRDLRRLRLLASIARGFAIVAATALPVLGQAPPLITELAYQTQGSPEALVVADFNGDGIPDVAVTSKWNSTTAPALSIYLGKGDGTFGAPTGYLTGVNLSQQIVSADFNGDGKADLCVADQSGNLWVLLGNGDGTFQAPVATLLGANTQFISMAIGDFNGDGVPDIAVSEVSKTSANSGSVEIFRGNGDGTFFDSAAAISGLTGIGQVLSGNFSQHGVRDLAVESSGALTVLNGNGAGGFATPITYVIDNTLPGIELQFPLLVADVNGDGHPDIVVNTFYPESGGDMGAIEVLLGTGAGTFTNGPTTNLGPTNCCAVTGAMAVADFNGDGKADLFLGNPNSGSPMLLFGNGDGSFQAPNNLFVNFSGTYGLEAQAVATADLNGDHKPDVVFAGPSNWLVSVLNTPGSVGFAIVPVSFDFGQQVVGAGTSSATFTIGNTTGNVYSFPSLVVSDPADFSTTSTCGSSLASDATCTITVTYNPQSTGQKKATISFEDNPPFPSASELTVTGSAIAPVVSTSASLLQFSYQKVGTTSAAQNVQITNSGVGPLTFTLSAQGDFAQTSNCPASLAQGASCTAAVTYTPEVPGAEQGRLVINSNAVPAQSAVALIGTGYIIGPVISVSPASIDFGSQYVGTSSAPSVVTVANNGDAPFNIASIAAGSSFVPLSTCGSSVQPSFSCAIGVFFDPATTGSQSSVLTITDNLASSPQQVALSGNGTQISVAPASGSSTAQTVTAGTTATFALTVSAVSGYTGTVNLLCTSLPAGDTFTLSQNTAVLNGTGPAAVTVSVATAAATANAARKAKLDLGPGGALLAFPVVLVFFGAGLSKRWRRNLFSVGVLMVVCAFAGSCGGASATATSSQTYVFFLQSQPAPGVTIETPLTLTVTQ